MHLELIETHADGFIGELSDQAFDGVTVVMPSTDINQAVLAAQRMARFAGMPMRMVIVKDAIRQGFIKTINAVSNRLKPEYLAYVAQDALAGKHWLKNAFHKMTVENKSVCAFNEGRFLGNLAQFGLVKVAFTARHYGDHNVFYEQYTKHRADDELTLLAKLNNEFVFAKDALLMEVDYSLQKTIHAPDVAVYRRRSIELKQKFAPSNT
jgi:hypothetical protein